MRFWTLFESSDLLASFDTAPGREKVPASLLPVGGKVQVSHSAFADTWDEELFITVGQGLTFWLLSKPLLISWL